MSVQSEAQLEHELIAQLKNLGYSQVDIKDETQLLSNLKIQVERANDISAFSANEWAQVLNHLKAGNSFNCAVLTFKIPIDKTRLDGRGIRSIKLECLSLPPPEPPNRGAARHRDKCKEAQFLISRM